MDWQHKSSTIASEQHSEMNIHNDDERTIGKLCTAPLILTALLIKLFFFFHREHRQHVNDYNK